MLQIAADPDRHRVTPITDLGTGYDSLEFLRYSSVSIGNTVIRRKFHTIRQQHSDAEDFIQTSIFTGHVGSRYYTSDFNVNVIDI